MYLFFITKALAAAKLLLYISFNGQQTPNSKLTLTNMYTHYLNEEGYIVNYILTLPIQLNQYLGINYTEVISNVLNILKIIKERLSYFITNNTYINNTQLNHLAAKFSFNKAYRYIYCAYHILNLITQQFIFSKDKEAFKNKDANIFFKKKEFLKQWRKEGLLKILQLIQLFKQY